MSLSGEWFLVEHVLSGVTQRVEHNYSGNNIDWDVVNETVLLAGLAAGCSLLERAGVKATNEHNTILFDIRNALIHNGGDLSKNHKSTALSNAEDYLRNNKHLNLSAEIQQPFFTLSDSIVKLEPNILYVIRLCCP
jgi:hypothetical protein